MAPATKLATAKSEPDNLKPTLPDLDPTLKSICLNILSLKDDSTTILASRQNAILDFYELISMSNHEIEQITVTEKGPPLPLMNGLSANLIWFKRWCAHLIDKSGGDVPDPEDIAKMDNMVFRKFRAITGSKDPIPESTTITMPTTQTTRPSDLVADFKRSIKRDASLYPNLKDHRQWNNWKRTVLAQAHAHDIQDVFDPNYTPATPEAEA